MMKTSLYTVGSRIKSTREAANLSQADLARKLSYKSASTIARIESGENDLNQTKLKAFASALGVSVGYLLGDFVPVTIHADAVREIQPASAENLRLVAVRRGLQSDINAALEKAIADIMQDNGDTLTADKNRRIEKDLPKSDAG